MTARIGCALPYTHDLSSNKTMRVAVNQGAQNASCAYEQNEVCQAKVTACPKTLKEITKEDARSVLILSFPFKSQKISGRLLKCFLWGIPQEMKLSQAKLEVRQTVTVDILRIIASKPATLPRKKTCQEESEFHS